VVSSLLLAVAVVRSSNTDDSRGLIESLIEQNVKLTAVADELGADVNKLRQQYDTFVARTATQRDDEEQWRREAAKKLE